MRLTLGGDNVLGGGDTPVLSEFGEIGIQTKRRLFTIVYRRGTDEIEILHKGTLLWTSASMGGGVNSTNEEKQPSGEKMLGAQQDTLLKVIQHRDSCCRARSVECSESGRDCSQCPDAGRAWVAIRTAYRDESSDLDDFDEAAMMAPWRGAKKPRGVKCRLGFANPTVQIGCIQHCYSKGPCWIKKPATKRARRKP